MIRTFEPGYKGLVFDYYDPVQVAWTAIVGINTSDPSWMNWWTQFAGHNVPTSPSYDVGVGDPTSPLVGSRWRDFAQWGFLFLGDVDSRGITLPTPSIDYRLAGMGTQGATGVKDIYQICRKRTAGDYKWLDIFDKFQSVSILKEVNGITKTDIGTTAVEILGVAHRSKVDLTYFDRCRVVFGGLNSENVAFRCQIQYSTDGTTWYALTPEASSVATHTTEQLVVGSWGNIPTGALVDVFIRAVGRAANTTADPTYKCIELQIK